MINKLQPTSSPNQTPARVASGAAIETISTNASTTTTSTTAAPAASATSTMTTTTTMTTAAAASAAAAAAAATPSAALTSAASQPSASSHQQTQASTAAAAAAAASNPQLATQSGNAPAPASAASASPIYHFKVLVPAAAAGRIIGKGGNAIVQLQKDAGARIKLSKASEFYPGTTERVCLISGPIEGILKIIESIVKSLTPDHLSRPNVSSTPPNNHNQNNNNINLGSANSNNGALGSHLNHHHHHHHSNNSSSIMNGANSLSTYGQLMSSSAASSSSPSTSSVAAVQQQQQQQQHLSPRPSNSLTPPGCNANGVGNSSSGGGGSIVPNSGRSLTPVGRPISPAPSGVTSDMNSAQIIETIKLVLRVSGYGEDAVSEISSGMSTLASYGVLGVGLGLL